MRPEFRIYRNLHKDCFSEMKWNQEKKGYRLHSHVKDLVAHDVEFRVSQAGRRRVLETKQKNVHAFVYCHSFAAESIQAHGEEIYYNPYKMDSFRIKNSDEPIKHASSIIMTGNKCYFKNVN